MEYVNLGLANVTFGLHLLFVLLMLPSTTLFCLGYYRTRPLLQQAHCAAILTMGVGQAVLLECPLVSLERALRSPSGDSLWYDGSFVVFIVERTMGFNLPVVVVAFHAFLVIVLTAAALLLPRVAALLTRRIEAGIAG